jgi:hypothetical protein
MIITASFVAILWSMSASGPSSIRFGGGASLTFGAVRVNRKRHILPSRPCQFIKRGHDQRSGLDMDIQVEGTAPRENLTSDVGGRRSLMFAFTNKWRPGKRLSYKRELVATHPTASFSKLHQTGPAANFTHKYVQYQALRPLHLYPSRHRDRQPSRRFGLKIPLPTAEFHLLGSLSP